MQFNRTQVGIAAGVGVLLIFVFLGYVIHLNNQGPVLGKSEERDPLTQVPNSIDLNPLRDRTSERIAAKFVRAMRDGKCDEQLENWEKDYRRKYAKFICESETQHPLVSWQLVDWDDRPPLRILQYRGKRLNGRGQPGTYKELFSVTLEMKDGEWQVTKYDAMY